LAISETSEKIGQVKYGEFVIIQDVFDFAYKDTINNRAGNWVKINYKGNIGFVFDGYLSKLPVPKLNIKINNYEDIDEVIHSNIVARSLRVPVFRSGSLIRSKAAALLGEFSSFNSTR
jgi:hypothetical protein